MKSLKTSNMESAALTRIRQNCDCLLRSRYHQINFGRKIPLRHRQVLPITETTNCELSVKKIFTILDMSSRFQHIEFDKDSVDYCTFQTQFGRYHFHRLCFGLSSAQEIFVERVASILGYIEDCCPYFDDLIVASEDEIEHDMIREQVLKRAHKFNVRFNLDSQKYGY